MDVYEEFMSLLEDPIRFKWEPWWDSEIGEAEFVDYAREINRGELKEFNMLLHSRPDFTGFVSGGGKGIKTTQFVGLTDAIYIQNGKQVYSQYMDSSRTNLSNRIFQGPFSLQRIYSGNMGGRLDRVILRSKSRLNGFDVEFYRYQQNFAYLNISKGPEFRFQLIVPDKITDYFSAEMFENYGQFKAILGRSKGIIYSGGYVLDESNPEKEFTFSEGMDFVEKGITPKNK